MKKIAVGEPSFANIINSESLYIDKTEPIYKLLQSEKYVFLSRPRRFGKSLLISTLQELFCGKRTLFKGLWIDNHFDFEPRPVILISFTAFDYKQEGLANSLRSYLLQLAQTYGVQQFKRYFI